MSKLKELIDRLCPDGVEFIKLKEIAQIGTGSSDKKDAVETGKYPFYVRSKNIERHDKFEYNEEAVIIPGEGGIGEIFHYANGPYALHQRVYRIHFNDSRVNTKYAYYYLFNHFKEFITKKAVSATVTSIRKPMIEDFPLPVPPIEVQEEIVRILDTFSAHAAELQAELQARKEQYEYYRNLLLTFNPSACGCGTDDKQEISVNAWGGHNYEITWKTMEEIGKFFSGLTGKSKSDFINGNARFISYMNVYSNIALNLNAEEFVQIGETEKQNTLEYGDAIFTGSSETPNECGMSSVVTKKPSEPLYLNSFCFGFRIDDKGLFAPDFLKHLLRSKFIRNQIAKTANGVTRFNVSKALFAKVVLPIPPYELQVKIASILDRFETLVNDLTEGLPAEIAAVKEQYEYYRNKLLTFKKAS